MEQAIADNQHFVYYLFNLTAGLLIGLSKITSVSYQCWNIVIWFGLIPASWIYLVSRKTSPWLNGLSLPIFIYLGLLQQWNAWFDQSVVLLNKIGGFIRADYRVTSVLVCLLLPWLVYFLLFAFLSSRAGFKKFIIATVLVAVIVIVLFPVSNYVLQQYR